MPRQKKESVVDFNIENEFGEITIQFLPEGVQVTAVSKTPGVVKTPVIEWKSLVTCFRVHRGQISEPKKKTRK